MAKSGSEEKTRQLYASIREDIYLAAKAKAAELRIPLKEFLEKALEQALTGELGERADKASVWKRPNLQVLLGDPLGSPIALTPEEAREIVSNAFGSQPDLPPGDEFTRNLKLTTGHLPTQSDDSG